MKPIFFTVTNDLSYDQRMHRICTTLATNGYRVMLVGRELKESVPLQAALYGQVRLRCRFRTGFLFYAEYNLRLFFFLLRQPMNGICAIDLDTILPCLFVSRIKRVPRIYDAHEYFTELKEVRTRPIVRSFWKGVEAFAVPRFANGYTVSQGLAEAFFANYKRRYAVVRNLPLLRPVEQTTPRSDVLLFQGAVNEARGFEFLIPAMKRIPYKLVICGDGNFMPQLRALVYANGVEDNVEIRGMLLPEALRQVASQAALGIGLAEKEGINQYHALPNKFLDYMHAGLPQVAMNFPEYNRVNSQFRVAVLLDELTIDGVADAINAVMADKAERQQMSENAMAAREIYCWQNEEKKLLQFYAAIFS